jgi:hypothetical protein
MNIPLLKGGLCNQLFQIAATYAHSLKHNQEFGINYNFPFAAHQGSHPRKYKDNFYSKIQSTDIMPNKTFNNLGYTLTDIPVEHNLIVDGYFQCYKFFENYITEVKNLFVFPDNIQQKITKAVEKINKPLCVIHIRRGDYKLLAPHHMVCNTDYYIKCAKKIKQTNADTLFIVITDDKQHVFSEFKKQFEDGVFIISNSADELEDLYLLTQADYIIGSNSSFSWWGAFFNKQKKRTLFPEVWFGPEGIKEYGNPDIYTDYMEKVKV